MVGMFAAQAIGCFGMAVLLVVAGRRLARLTWVATAGLASAAIVGYVVVRSVPMPDLEDRIGAWLDPAGIVALTVEVLLVGVCARGIPLLGTELRERVPARRPTKPAAAGLVGVALALGVLPLAAPAVSQAHGGDGEDASGFPSATQPDHQPSRQPEQALAPARRSFAQRDAQRVSTAAHADGDHASFDGWVVALLGRGHSSVLGYRGCAAVAPHRTGRRTGVSEAGAL